MTDLSAAEAAKVRAFGLDLPDDLWELDDTEPVCTWEGCLAPADWTITLRCCHTLYLSCGTHKTYAVTAVDGHDGAARCSVCRTVHPVGSTFDDIIQARPL